MSAMFPTDVHLADVDVDVEAVTEAVDLAFVDFAVAAISCGT